MQTSLADWIESAESPDRRLWRQALHAVLLAIGLDRDNTIQATLKGGMLLALRYGSPRFTNDLDFSTSILRQNIDQDKIRSNLDRSLQRAVDRLDLGMRCRVQSSRWKPSDDQASTPTLKLTIGYARLTNVKELRRLDQLNSSRVVHLDLSANETTYRAEEIKVTDEVTVRAYALSDLVAEKYRSLLQQESRNRTRRQDVYDLWFLLAHARGDMYREIDNIYEIFRSKCRARNIAPGKTDLARAEIRNRSRAEYPRLQDELAAGTLPDFDIAYSEVRTFYEELPWP